MKSMHVQKIEHGSFTTSGGMHGTYCNISTIHITSGKKPYSHTVHWLRCRLSFSLIDSAIMCLQGSHSNKHHASNSAHNIDFACCKVKNSLQLLLLYLTLCHVFHFGFMVVLYNICKQYLERKGFRDFWHCQSHIPLHCFVYEQFLISPDLLRYGSLVPMACMVPLSRGVIEACCTSQYVSTLMVSQWSLLPHGFLLACM